MISSAQIGELLARTNLADVASRYTALKHHGHEYLGICPFHAERTPSFTIFESRSGKDRFHCHGCGAGGDALDFIARYHSCDLQTAISILEGSESNVAPIQPKSIPKKAQRLTRPAEPKDGIPNFNVRYWGDPTMTWAYRSAKGAALFHVARYEFDNGGKTKKATPQWTVGSTDGGRTWAWGLGHYSAPRPLYGLDRLALAPHAPVLLCEGEKGADAAQRLLPDYVAMTWPGGANGIKHVDFAPMEGRDVILWPDADAHVYPPDHAKAGELMPLSDQVGTRAMVQIASLIMAQARSIRLVQVPVDPETAGWDAADIEQANWSHDYLVNWLEERSQSWSSFAVLDPKEIEANEDAIALAMADRYANILRYCHDWGYWLEWDGSRWREERKQIAFHYAREIARLANVKHTAGISKAGTASGAEKFCRADPRIATVSDDWDHDPWLLATADGNTIDLRTGDFFKSRADDRITKRTGCSTGSDECPTWLSFLEDATRQDGEMIDYLQRVAGYALTGSVKEHALFFVYGDGGNGKGTFINTLTGILQDYAVTANMDAFTASKHDRHPTELARMRGSRLVTAQETEEGRHWADVRIKALTGGDPITARFMHKNFFTFAPTFKILIAGNHKPALKTVDQAMRRRFQIIPFVNKPITPDKDLASKLQPEWGAILNWMVEGCLIWQRIGLQPPAVVASATDEYFEEQNTFAQWLAEGCEIGINERDTSASLFGSWKKWCDSNGEYPGTSKTFASHLVREGFKPAKSGSQRMWIGLRAAVADTQKSFHEID